MVDRFLGNRSRLLLRLKHLPDLVGVRFAARSAGVAIGEHVGRRGEGRQAKLRRRRRGGGCGGSASVAAGEVREIFVFAKREDMEM